MVNLQAQLRAAQAEYAAADAAYDAESAKLPEDLPPTAGFRDERPPEFMAASERLGTARRNLEAAEDTVINTPDTPKAVKLELLGERRTEAADDLAMYQRGLESEQGPDS